LSAQGGRVSQKGPVCEEGLHVPHPVPWRRSATVRATMALRPSAMTRCSWTRSERDASRRSSNR